MKMTCRTLVIKKTVYYVVSQKLNPVLWIQKINLVSIVEGLWGNMGFVKETKLNHFERIVS